MSKDVASSFEMIGSATSGVTVLTVGVTLSAHSFHLSKAVLFGARKDQQCGATQRSRVPRHLGLGRAFVAGRHCHRRTQFR